MIISIQELFEIGMKYKIGSIFTHDPGSVALNLGAGPQVIPGTIPLDYERGWDADVMPLPYPDGSVDFIHAYHFFEHLHDPRKMLLECERVLRPGGRLSIGVPYYASEIAFTDLDHKHYFTLRTWRQTLGQVRYQKYPYHWKLQITAEFVMMLEERSQMIFTQMIRS
jgi:ubiquinone/menaquinone biosynthesis C-methylase UbiE